MIKLAKLEDILFINEIGNEYKNNFEKTYKLKEYLDNENYYILVNKEDKINGFMIVYKNIDYYELEMIVVSKECHNKGIATKILKYFCDNFMNKNDSIILEVSVLNNKAINLYKKFCFEIINVRKKYYDNKIDAYIMKKVI